MSATISETGSNFGSYDTYTINGTFAGEPINGSLTPRKGANGFSFPGDGYTFTGSVGNLLIQGSANGITNGSGCSGRSLCGFDTTETAHS